MEASITRVLLVVLAIALLATAGYIVYRLVGKAGATAGGSIAPTTIEVAAVDVSGDTLNSITIHNTGNAPLGDVDTATNWLVVIRMYNGTQASINPNSVSELGSADGSLEPDEYLQLGWTSGVDIGLTSGPASIVVIGPNNVKAVYSIAP